jgi:hypothetical protein
MRLLIVCFFALTAAQASEKADPPFEPASFGVNINQSLINPFDDPATGAMRLRRELATIFYEVRRIGGRTVRWFNDDVWTQYECGKDPENQATGEIDQAWYEITRALLEEAQRWHVKVVISLMDMAGSTFSDSRNVTAARSLQTAPCQSRCGRPRSRRISRAAFRPTTPPTPPPGCAEDPH